MKEEVRRMAGKAKRRRIANGAKWKDDSSDNLESTTVLPKIRNLSKLYVAPQTIQCARNGCTPCAYKIGNFDVALDTDFTRRVPNQRPEQCPRSQISSKKMTNGNREPLAQQEIPNGPYGFLPGMKVLTVGDGDLSFSLAIARILFQDEGPGSGESLLVATSYEAKETLESVYPHFLETLSELEGLGVKICYQVDATKLSETCPVIAKSTRFDRIVWNFPCSAIAQGQDGQNAEMEANQRLIRKFAKEAQSLLREGGEVHMSHKTKPPFNQWRLEEQVRLGSPELEYMGRIVLDRYLLPPYVPRKALDAKSFPCHDACVFVFGAPPHASSTLHSRKWAIPLTKEIVDEIRNLQLEKKISSPSRKGKRKSR